MRILIQSSAPFTHGGYAHQSSLLATKLLQNHYEVVFLSNFGLRGGIINYKLKYKNETYSLTILPSGLMKYCQDIVGYYYQKYKCDVILTHCDVFVLNNYGRRFPNRWIALFPIDHQPVSKHITKYLEGCWKPVSYSKFAINELKKKNIKATYMPLAVDTTIFKSVKNTNLKSALGFKKNTFLFGIIAANQDYEDRKQFSRQFIAFSKFLKKHSDARLFIHSFPYYPGMPSVPILDYVKTLGIERYTRITNKWEYLVGLPQHDVNLLYNGMDCLLNCSSAEGFGIPIIEAQAAGTPVIVNNFSAMPELIVPGKTGEITKTDGNEFVSYGTFRQRPNINSIVEKMEIVYKNIKDNPDYYKNNCRRHIELNYDIEVIWDKYMKSFFRKVEKEIGEEQVIQVENI